MIKFNLSRQRKIKIAQMDFASVLDEESQQHFNSRLVELSRDIPYPVMANFAATVVAPLNQEFLQFRELGVTPWQIEDKARAIADDILRRLEEGPQQAGPVVPGPVEGTETPRQINVEEQQPQGMSGIFDLYIQENLVFEEDGIILVKTSNFSSPPQEILDNFDNFNIYLENRLPDFTKREDNGALESVFRQSMIDSMAEGSLSRGLTPEQIDDSWEGVMLSTPGDEKFKKRLADYRYNKETTKIDYLKKRPENGHEQGVMVDHSEQALRARVMVHELMTTDYDLASWYKTNETNLDEGLNKAFSQTYLQLQYTTDPPTYSLLDKGDGRLLFLINDQDKDMTVLRDYNQIFPCADLMKIYNTYKNRKSLLYTNLFDVIQQCKDNKLEEFINNMIENKDQRVVNWVKRQLGALGVGQKFKQKKEKPIVVRKDNGKGEGQYEREGQSYSLSTGAALSLEQEYVFRDKAREILFEEFNQFDTVMKSVIPSIHRMGVAKEDSIRIRKTNTLKFLTNLYKKRLDTIINKGKFVVKDERGPEGGKTILRFYYPKKAEGKKTINLNKAFDPDSKNGYMTLIFDPNNVQGSGMSQINFRNLITKWGDINVSLEEMSNKEGEKEAINDLYKVLSERMGIIDRVYQKFKNIYSHGKNLNEMVGRIVSELNADSGTDVYDIETVKYMLMSGKSDLILENQVPTKEQYSQCDNENRRLKKACAELDGLEHLSDEKVYDYLIVYKMTHGLEHGSISLSDIQEIRKNRSEIEPEQTPEEQQSSYKKIYGIIDETGKMDAQRTKHYNRLLRNIKGDEVRYEIIYWSPIILDLLSKNKIRFESLKTLYKVIGPQFKVFLPLDEEGKRNLAPGSPHSIRSPIGLYFMQKPLSTFKLEAHRRGLQKYMSDGMGGLSDAEGNPIEDQIGIWATDDEDGNFVKWVWQQMKTGKFVAPTPKIIQNMISRLDRLSPSKKMSEFAYFRAKKKIAQLLNMKKSMIKLSSKPQQIDDLIEKVRSDYFADLRKYLGWGEKYDQDFSYLPMWQYRI